MRVWVRGYLGLRALLGDQPFVEIDGDRATIRDLLDQLAHRVGVESAQAAIGLDARETDRRLVLLVNGRHTSHLPDGLDTVLMDGDQVAIFPPVAGG